MIYTSPFVKFPDEPLKRRRRSHLSGLYLGWHGGRNGQVVGEDGWEILPGYSYKTYISHQANHAQWSASTGLFLSPVEACVCMNDRRGSFRASVHLPNLYHTRVEVLRGRHDTLGDALAMVEEELRSGEHVRECLRLYYAQSKRVDVYSVAEEQHVMTFFDWAPTDCLPSGFYITIDDRYTSIIHRNGHTTTWGVTRGVPVETIYSVYRLGGGAALETARFS